ASQEDGFSIIDALLSIVLLAMGMLVLGNVTGSVVDKNGDGKKTTIATNLAQEKLEDIKNQVLAGPLTDGSIIENKVDDNGVAGNGIYTRTTVVTGGGADSLATVVVTVAWADRVNQSVTLATTVSQ
ncbi:MAG: hypothetical protein ACE5GQ_04840, partial [Nitrospinales bacterium]